MGYAVSISSLASLDRAAYILAPLIEESRELSLMMGASVATARSRMGETWNSATYDGIGHASGTGAGAGLLTDDRLHTCTLAH